MRWRSPSPTIGWRRWLAGWVGLCAAAAVASEVEAPKSPETRQAIERGAAVYAERCASCHDHPTGRTPYRSALQYRSASAVVRSLTLGAMRPMATGIPAPDALALAAFLTGQLPVAEPEPKPNRCSEPGGPVSIDPGDWPVLGRDLANTRHQPEPGFATGARRWSQHFKTADRVAECRKAHAGSDCRNLFDFATSVVLERLQDGREILVAGQKSGLAVGLDPDAGGKLLWSTQVSRGSDLGGPMYGLAVDGPVAFFPISDTPDNFTQPPDTPGGLVALDVRSGGILWRRKAAEPVCSWGRQYCLSASIAAATALPGAVFQGNADGRVRAYSTKDGAPIWSFDTARSFPAVNGVDARGGPVNGWPIVVANGAVYVVSGSSTQSHPGNALLVFSVDGR